MTSGTGVTTVTVVPSGSTATTVSVVTPVWPYAVGAARVAVTTAAGTSTQPVFFNFTSITIPVLTSLNPTHGPLPGGNTTIITGSNLLYTTGVTFTQGATTVPASSFAVLSNTQLAVVVPPAPAGPGAASVSVRNGAGSSATTLTYTYDSAVALPTVMSVVPNNGPASGGNTVALTGTGFSYATRVNFGSTPAPSFSVTSDTSITATVPPGTGTVTVTVSSPAGNGVVGAPYTYNAAPTPSISSGNTVTITGTNLNTVTAVRFNGTPATIFTILSPTAINVTAPAGSVAGPVNPSCTYTYIALPAPVSIFPTAGIISRGTPVAITGTGLTGTSSVLFGTTPAASITVVSDTEVDAITPPHAVGTVPIIITTPGGTDTSTSFSFQPPPVITSSSPSQGSESGGTTVTINGAGLIIASGVYFGATPAASFTLVSDNLITAVSPPGTGVVAITVSTPAAFSNGAKLVMADAMVEEPATTTRSGHVITPSTRAREAIGSTNNTSNVKASKKSMTQMELTASVMIQEQSNTIKALQTQLETVQCQSIEECKQLREQLETMANTPINAALMQTKSQPSFADMISSQSSHQQDTHLGPLAPPTVANTLFCTIDTSRVGEEDKAKAQIANIRQQIEKEMRGTMAKDPKNADRVKVICRHEDEIQQVKEATQKINMPGMRVLRDQLYPVKIDNANQTAVLDADGNILPGAVEVLGKENNVNIAKISWISKKDSNKAYGSIVVYITKGTDAKQLIDGNYFDITGESAYTRIFEQWMGLAQYFNY
ncbi:conserved hypothetical protein [Talaromyces stipitatus ATCC 10500]|uniref:IPT/TIG domain-containing protein n=1 Tax=Talaromyces stipitatus (strain ATCC 10500 / CBS 375.48 / QM 6759 / NRRL 1006) TaxID=441959 RepID=B8MAG9_TALSN|nr:uncharacterized protein TSTA_112260 [Talaromyces stipitatus ATCC 10500]EED17393.1 conserved hypothetical protein [Talaromyces stipitatus ATCC 10500]